MHMVFIARTTILVEKVEENMTLVRFLLATWCPSNLSLGVLFSSQGINIAIWYTFMGFNVQERVYVRG